MKAGAWLVAVSAAVALVTALIVRTRAPSWVVTLILAASGGNLMWGALLLRDDPGIAQTFVGVAAMSMLVPLHVRVVLGPFGRRRT